MSNTMDSYGVYLSCDNDRLTDMDLCLIKNISI